MRRRRRRRLRGVRRTPRKHAPRPAHARREGHVRPRSAAPCELGRCPLRGGEERARRRAFDVEESPTIVGIDQAGQKHARRVWPTVVRRPRALVRGGGRGRGRGAAHAGIRIPRVGSRRCRSICLDGRSLGGIGRRMPVVAVVVVDGRGGRRGAADYGVDPAGRGRGGREHGHDALQVRGGRPGGGAVGPGNTFLLLRSRRWWRRRLVVVVVATTEA